MKFGEIFWSEMKIETLKGGGGCKHKGNNLFSRCQIVKATIKWLLQMKNEYPNVQLHYLPDLLF